MIRTRITKIYVGIDNGVSGTIGFLPYNGMNALVLKTPIKNCLNYQKEVRYINRIDVKALEALLTQYSNLTVFMERPLVNPSMFQATLSAVRAFEATLTVMDRLELPVHYVDSREWQSEILPSGIKGPDNLKYASMEVGVQLFPYLKEYIYKHKDADGLLIAEWARRRGL